MRLLFLLLAAFAAGDALAQRYVVVREDGKRETGNKLEDLFEYDEHGKLDGRSLLGVNNPMRVLVDTSQKAKRPTEWVELDNGDVLAGRVTQFVPAGNGVAAYVLVAVKGLPMLGETMEVRVRPQSILAFYATEAEPPLKRGEIRDKAGRMFFSNAVRWKEHGLKLLTDGGIREVEFSQITAARLPKDRDVNASIRDGLWLEKRTGGEVLRKSDCVVRVSTDNGSHITFCRGMQAWEHQRTKKGRSRNRRMGVRPNWALSTFFIDAAAVVRFAARKPNEVPLSSLPAKVLRVRRGLHHLLWRRGRSVLGNPPAIKDQPGGWCIGTHSHSEIAFTLPAHAQAFRATVGFDPAVGEGGCVGLEVYKDEVTGSPLWKTVSFRGSAAVKKIGPLTITGAKRLILVTTFGDVARPKGADPLDIRDCVNWIDPMVTVKSLPDPRKSLTKWIPLLTGWEAKDTHSWQLAPHWDELSQLWRFSVVPNSGKVVFQRMLDVTYSQSWISLAAARARAGKRNCDVSLRADSEPLSSTLNGDISATRSDVGVEREYSLGVFIGRKVPVELVITPGKGTGEPSGIVLRNASLLPLVQKLPDSGRPILPDVRLESQKPIRNTGISYPLKPGRVADKAGSPLEIYRHRFPTGFGVPTGSSLTYRLSAVSTGLEKNKRPKEFVAVIGLAEGWKGAGPYEVLFDNRLFWSSASGFVGEVEVPKRFEMPLIEKLDRNSRAMQVRIPIPEAAKTITLRLRGDKSHGAWGLAGFRVGK